MELREKLCRCAEILDDEIRATVFDGPFAIDLDGEKAREVLRMLKKGWGPRDALRQTGAKIRRVAA